MQRGLIVGALVLATAVSAGCSDDSGRTLPPDKAAAAQNAPLTRSAVLGTPFDVDVEGGKASVTLEGLRIVASSVYTDTVYAVDMRAVQSSGRPVIDPDQLRAFEPAGHAFERVAYPKGTVADQLVRTQLTSQGQEVRGTVVWTAAPGLRIGRIDYATGQVVHSVTITRQPEDPEATTASSTTASGSG